MWFGVIAHFMSPTLVMTAPATGWAEFDRAPATVTFWIIDGVSCFASTSRAKYVPGSIFT